MRVLRSILVLLSGFLSITVFAQSTKEQNQIGQLSGTIVDGSNKAVSYATVTLLKKDSTIVGGDLTNDQGRFTITPTGTGDFLLRINIIGFKVRYINGININAQNLHKDLGKISLSEAAHQLSEVAVTGEKSLMQLEVDKKVFNVEKNTTTVGGSALDVLKDVPSLNVDVDGDISLRGKTATILIDGKPATLLGDDVSSALQSLPSSGISSVEVITNPSAKYDAQGLSGIINIITKKDNKFGINGNASIGVGTKDKYNASLSLNVRNKKWNIFLNSNYRKNNSYQHTVNERTDWHNELTSASYEEEMRTHGGFFNSLGAEYNLNDRNTITLTQNINSMLFGHNGPTTFNNYNNDVIDSSQVRTTNSQGSPFSSSTSLDYKHKFSKPKQELTSNINFTKTWVSRSQEFVTSFFDSLGNEYPDKITQNAPGNGTNTSLNAQADYTTPFLTKTGRLDIGWKSQLYWFESANNAQIKYKDAAAYQTDSLLQNDYKYNQQIHAVYASVNDERGNFGYQAGLRTEFSAYEGTSSLLKSGEKYANQFLGLFPSLFLSYKLPKDQAVYLSYSRRTDRPSFFQMMPYIDVSNPMDTSAGNPSLIPEFIHNTELNYSRQYKQGHVFIASLYYQYTQNLIDRIRRFDTTTGKSFSQPQNLNHGITYGIELTGKMQLLPIWDATINFNFFQNEIYGNNLNNNLNNSGNSFFTKLNTNIKLPYNFSFQLSGNYEAPKVAAQGKVQEVYWIDVALKKQLLKNKASITLNVSDLFNTRKYRTNYDFGTSFQTIYRDRETRVGNLTFSYRFGKSEFKNNRKNKAQSLVEPIKERDNIKQGEGDSGGY